MPEHRQSLIRSAEQILNNIFRQKNKAVSFGLGIGLFMMVVAALFLDVAAQRRAAVYTRALESFIHQK